MKEYDIYLPTTFNDGTPVAEAVISGIRGELADAFGGYTHQVQRSEGAWRVGTVTFLDEVTIVTVLDDGTAHFDMALFKRQLEDILRQETVLIVAREVQII